jgi:hypothetical protein
MLRYFAYAERDFQQLPDRSDHRLNWEFWIAFRSKVRPSSTTNPTASSSPRISG